MHTRRPRIGRTLVICLLIGLSSLLAASRAAAQMQFAVTDEATLITAIETVSVDFASGSNRGPYDIELLNDITLTRSMPSLRAFMPSDGSVAVTIEGNGYRIDANNAGRVFVFASGRFSIGNLIIANAHATGGPGGNSYFGGGGGGGLGAGAAIFVNAGASVTASSVIVENAAARGGNGGSFFTGAASESQGGGGVRCSSMGR